MWASNAAGPRRCGGGRLRRGLRGAVGEAGALGWWRMGPAIEIGMAGCVAVCDMSGLGMAGGKGFVVGFVGFDSTVVEVAVIAGVAFAVADSSGASGNVVEFEASLRLES